MQSNQKPLYLLSYDHGGYILWGDRFAERLSSAAEWMRKYPKFKFGLDNEAYTYDAYAEEYPEIMQKIRDMLHLYPGRFGIGTATYGQPLSAFIDHESNVRQLTYAIEACEKHFGIRPPVYAMSEHAMHAQIPQLIAGCGYDMALMRTHFQMYGFNPTYPVSCGRWVGIDGTRIPTVPTYDEQGAHFGRTTIDNWILTRWPKEATESPEDFEKMFENIHPLLASRYDDVILRCEEMTAYAEQKEHYHWVILEDFAKLYAGYEDQMEFVTKPKDFTLRMPWGYCGNVIFRQTVKAQDAVARAERLAAIAKCYGADCDKGDLKTAWKNLLVAQHHDVQICGLLKEADRFLGRSLAASNAVTSRAMQAISQVLGGDQQQNLLVVNPSAYKQKQRVAFELSGRALENLVAVCDGERIPCRVTPLAYDPKAEHIHSGIVNFVCELEGFESKVFTFEPGEAEQKIPFSIEEEVFPDLDPDMLVYDGQPMYGDVHYHIRVGNYELLLDPYGFREIKHIDGRVILTMGRVYCPIYDGWEYSKGEWSFYKNEKGVTFALHGTMYYTIGVTLSLTVDTDSDALHFQVTTEHHGQPIGFMDDPDTFWNNTDGFVSAYKLRFQFIPGFDLKTATGIYTQPFVIDETMDKDIQGNDFCALTNGEQSLLFSHDGGKCLSKWHNYVIIPLAFSHEYAWGVKALQGRYENNFTLLPLTGCSKTKMLRENEGYHLPFETFVFDKTKVGVNAPHAVPIKLKMTENAAVSALYPTENGVALRLWETLGEQGDFQLEAPLGKGMRYTDLLGNPTGETPLSAHKIVTVELML